jgi:hypothetical protein
MAMIHPAGPGACDTKETRSRDFLRARAEHTKVAAPFHCLLNIGPMSLGRTAVPALTLLVALFLSGCGSNVANQGVAEG